MKYVLLGSVCLSVVLTGCQTYPKKPTSPKTWGKYELVNKQVPSELQPFTIPENTTYTDKQKLVPKKVVVTKSKESANAF